MKRSRLHPRDSAREIVNFFLDLLRAKGFSTRFPSKTCEKGGTTNRIERRKLEGELYEKVSKFLNKAEFVRSLDLEIAGQRVLSIHMGKRRFAGCSDMNAAQAKSYPRPKSREDLVSLEEINSLTVCFACCFAREGYSSMHSVPYLDELREIVVSVLCTLEYRPQERESADVRVLPDWTRTTELFCLARKTGSLHRLLRDGEKVQCVVFG